MTPQIARTLAAKDKLDLPRRRPANLRRLLRQVRCRIHATLRLQSVRRKTSVRTIRRRRWRLRRKVHPSEKRLGRRFGFGLLEEAPWPVEVSWCTSFGGIVRLTRNLGRGKAVEFKVGPLSESTSAGWRNRVMTFLARVKPGAELQPTHTRLRQLTVLDGRAVCVTLFPRKNRPGKAPRKSQRSGLTSLPPVLF